MTPLDRRTVAGILAGIRARVRRRGSAAALLLAAGALAAVLPLAWLLGSADGWRAGSPLPLVLVLLGLAAAAGMAGWALFRIRRRTDESALASDVERSAGLASGALRAQLELGRGVPEGVSGGLARAGEAALVDRLTRAGALHPREAEAEARRLLRAGALLTGGVAILALALLALAPERSRATWAGLASPVGILLPDPLPPLEVHPGEAELPRGEEVRVRVSAPGRETVTLHWESAGDVPRSVVLPVSGEEAAGTLPELQGTTRYRVTAPDGARSPEYTLRPLDPLVLGGLSVELRFPPHTGLPPEVIRGEPGLLRLPRGTRVLLSGSFLGEGEAILLRDPEGRRLAAFPLEGEGFAGEWLPSSSVEARWEVPGEAPAGLRLPAPLRVELLPDQPPSVSLDTESGTRQVAADLRVALRLEASDDWGLDWVELEVAVEDPRGRRGEPTVDRSGMENRRSVVLRPVLDMSGWGLEPGSRLRLRARAADRAPVPGVSASAELVLELPGLDRIRDEARSRVEQGLDQVEELVDRAARSEGELRDRAREMAGQEARSGGQTPSAEEFQAREEARRLLEEQAAVLDEMERLREEMARAREALGGEAGDTELGQRLRELERLLEQLDGGEARERLSDMTERFRDGEQAPRAADLEEAAARQEELRERLEEALERFRQAALENAFEGAEEAARELAQDQEEMAERLREGAEAEGQEALRDRAAQVEERVRALEERLREAGEMEAADRAAQAGREMEAAARAMEEAADAARSGDAGEAGERGEEAADAANSAMEELEQARMDWMEEWEERIREALRRAAQDAVALARRQGEIREELQVAGALRRTALLAEEAVLLEGLRNLGTAVGLATRQAASVGRELSQALGEAMEAVDRTATGLRTSAPRSGPYAAAGQAQAAMNRVAILALQGMEQVGQRGDANAAQELMEALEELAGQQEALNQEAGQLSQEPGADGASARMEELAGAQETMAGALGELADHPQGESVAGDLEAMAEEAREIAESLRGERIQEETLRRQEELLERLLTAGRTLERDGPTERREGTTAGPVDRPPVRALPGDLLRGTDLPLPSAEALEALSPAERRLVLDYFDRLNRGNGGSAPSPSPGGEP
jgi:hypothetical protein